MMSHARISGGFTLIEVMISMALGLILTAAVVQVLISNSVTERLNRAMASAQENGRFAITRLRQDVIMTGRYDPISGELNTNVDVVDEAAFLQNHPIPLPGDFANGASIGAIQGANGANDTLVVSLQAERDCRGYKLGYANGEEFFVVNQYFVDSGQLKCRGFDGRVLRGQQAAVGNNGDAAFTLLDDVESFQVLYGVSGPTFTGDNTARPAVYVTADDLQDVYDLNGQVVSVRIAILVKGDGDVIIDPVPNFKLLNEDPVTPSENRLYKVFETTITLRNVKNFVRSRKV